LIISTYNLNELIRKSGEKKYHYLWRIGKKIESKQLPHWSDCIDIINREFFKDEESPKYVDESALRKKVQYANCFYDEGVFDSTSASNREKELDIKIRELERAKIQFRDQRNAWQKQNFIDSRVQEKLDYLEECMEEFGKIEFELKDTPCITSDNDMLIILSDLHLGQCFSSSFGEYNSDIAKERLNKYLSSILQLAKLHNSENCYVSISGDLISGNIHKTIQVANRENVIDQIELAVEYISSFCYELCKNFTHVYVTDVSGNHSRMTKKDEALKDERLDNLIGRFVKKALKYTPNFTFINNDIDIGISKMTIRNLDFLNVHGDYDPFTTQGVLKLCSFLKMFPYAITFAHLHTPALDDANGIKMVRGGCLSGSGCDYTIEKRLNGKASQMACIVNKTGIIGAYPVVVE